MKIIPTLLLAVFCHSCVELKEDNKPNGSKSGASASASQIKNQPLSGKIQDRDWKFARGFLAVEAKEMIIRLYLFDESGPTSCKYNEQSDYPSFGTGNEDNGLELRIPPAALRTFPWTSDDRLNVLFASNLRPADHGRIEITGTLENGLKGAVKADGPTGSVEGTFTVVHCEASEK